ncbi:unnamed protein product [Discosporangium mesarthrocarpum]
MASFTRVGVAQLARVSFNRPMACVQALGFGMLTARPDGLVDLGRIALNTRRHIGSSRGMAVSGNLHRCLHSTGRAPVEGPSPASPRRLGADVEERPFRTEVPQPDRLVVIGDVHGDIDAFRSCLRMANLVDLDDRWSGGEAVLVQLGDIFDRGDDDLVIEEWVHLLAGEAERAGGGLYSILGNHEARRQVLNAAGDHSMATRESFDPFAKLTLPKSGAEQMERLKQVPEWAHHRILAMMPGSPVAKLMASHAVCMKVGDSLFVHGGLLPVHLTGAGAMGGSGSKEDNEGGGAGGGSGAVRAMERLNSAASKWLAGEGPALRLLFEQESPIWTRAYSSPDSREVGVQAWVQLREARKDIVLRLTGTKRMFVGHTPQEMGINSAAGGQVWRVDTAMSQKMGGRPEVLEMVGGEITILTEYKPIPASKRVCRPAPKHPVPEE